MTLPSREEDIQTNKWLNEKSAKSVADHTLLLALWHEAASGEFGLLAGAKERSREHDVWGTSFDTSKRVSSKG